MAELDADLNLDKEEPCGGLCHICILHATPSPCFFAAGHEGQCVCGLHCNHTSGKDESKSILLKDLAVDPASTRKCYDRALKIFINWLDINDLGKLEELVQDVAKFDEILERFLQHLFNSNTSKSMAGTVCSAVQDKFPRIRKNIPISWRTVGAWTYLRPGTPRRAWPPQLTLAVARVAKLKGRLDVAVWVLLSHHCMLRPNEACKLCRSDLQVSEHLTYLGRRLGIVQIRSPKTRRRAAPTQHVTIENEDLLDLLEDF